MIQFRSYNHWLDFSNQQFEPVKRLNGIEANHNNRR